MMAAFKAHCNFGFCSGREIINSDGSKANVGMGGKFAHITSVKEVPSAEEVASYLKQTIALNEKAPKKASKTKTVPKRAKVPPKMPAEFGRLTY